jgi:hypothetical protein
MEDTKLLQNEYRRLEQSLSGAIENLRSRRDAPGLDAFLDSVDDMEDIVDACLHLEQYEPIGYFLPYIRLIQTVVQNEDIVALTDIMEFMLLPLAKKALEGTDQV